MTAGSTPLDLRGFETFCFRPDLEDSPSSTGAEAMSMDAFEKVEKEIKKPLMKNDKKGMALLTQEFNKINQKYSIRGNLGDQYACPTSIRIETHEVLKLLIQLLPVFARNHEVPLVEEKTTFW
ncbi:hypothetical protein L1987_03410 [Smallanthus sonchifolius]|uniref:Uncharacterized protein n=1 Tax=Smallanthus sonchifolius TaxID=185202 RepID=A0ACB9KAE5_9ASTR|nr:hypothetical protein L1987_03410 [Smallanthus sonchifolius]